MQYKIGVFGSAVKEKDEVIAKAKALGQALGRRQDIIIINGACTGLPYITSYEAAKAGREVWGFSPEIDLANQKLFTPNEDMSIYTKLVYVPKDFLFAGNPMARKKYRNVISTASCDAGIIISGRWGTMNEFTNLFDMGKVIGVLTGTGGIADELELLNQKVHKPGKAIVYFSRDPKELVKLVIGEVEKRKSANKINREKLLRDLEIVRSFKGKNKISLSQFIIEDRQKH